MRAHGELMGAMALFAGKGRPPYQEDDLRFAESIGTRAAMGLLNARLYREARDAIRLRDDFLSVASHELRTPPTSLRLIVEGLARGPSIDARVSQKLLTAERQINRLTDLIDQLLDVSQVVGGELRMHLEEVDLSALVHEVVERLHEAIVRSKSSVDLHLEGAVVGRWDRQRLARVVTSLLSNALKYGEGRPIEVALDVQGATAELTVRDHGIGIDIANQTRIFDRFERAVSIRHYGGFGVGLWITRQTVEALGGTVEVESLPGQGSAFRVALPLVLPSPA